MRLTPEEPEILDFAPQHKRASGLTGYGWTYPLEQWLFAFGSAPFYQSKSGWRFRAVNANLFRGCANGCAYCYVRAGMPRFLGSRRAPGTDPQDTVCAQTGQFSAVMGAIAKSRSWRAPKVLILSSTTDPFAPGRIRHEYQDIIDSAGMYGVPVVTLTKQVPPPGVYVRNGAVGHSVVAGWTLTAPDDVAREIEPHSPATSERLAALAATTEYLTARRYPGMTWASITPVHDLSGDVGELAGAAFAHGASFCAAELLHVRNKWSREHQVPEDQILVQVERLLSASEQADRPVFLKDELRDVALASPAHRERYTALVLTAVRKRWPGHAGVVVILDQILGLSPVSPVAAPEGPRVDRQGTLDALFSTG